MLIDRTAPATARCLRHCQCVAADLVFRMLPLRSTCGHCNRALPPESTLTRIGSFECTFRAPCVELLGNVGPTGGGPMRPVRPMNNWQGGNPLGHDPASITVLHRPVDFGAHAKFAAALGLIPPEQP